MELKDIVKEHLVNEKEQQRLKNIEANSKLKKVTLFTDGSPYCDTIKKHLDQEGISYIEKTKKKHPKEVQEAIATTNLGIFPLVFINDIYLVYKRDFQSPQQLVQGIIHTASPDFIKPNPDLKTIEYLKTSQYHIWTKINNLENKLTPVINILTKLSEELGEDDE